MPGIPIGLGGAGPIGGGFTGGAATATAGQSRSGDISPNIVVNQGAGNRGFVNNPVFPGGRSTNDNSINTGTTGVFDPMNLAIIGAVALLVLFTLRH